jgi:hypothetical protein
MSIDHKDFTFSQLQVVRAPRHTLVLDRKPNWRYAPLTPKEQLSNIAWRYFGIVAIEEQVDETKCQVRTCDIEAALHAAFVAGMRHVSSRSNKETP